MSLILILSIVTGDSLTRSGALEAEITISSSFVSSATKTEVIVWFAEETCTVWVPYPILVISTEKGGFFEVFNENFPSTSETVPSDSPTTLTLAPGIGSFLLSFTEPDIVLCANEMPQKNNVKIK